MSIQRIFVLLLVLLGSCQLNRAVAQKNDSVKVKPPAMDIHTAVLRGDTSAIRQHLAAGTDINTRDVYGGSSPLISACLFGKSAIAQLLIDAGADINLRNNDGSTALHTAAFFGRPDLVALLLKKGADKKVKNRYGQTAYESVAGPFVDVKEVYDMLEQALGPMGLKLDYDQLEKTRPVIAAMLK
ncbi:ankyrin repeat domain-containing protein [Paraflavitalea pollutisoli]|uniref:ankyrin repeat domain-containing protein n=1 Tax=Paraflavitalea pollutisoli TaxID=3034143 RepID=UPI0023EDD2DE|nr:ankyrin repeat domain-containing protein [Paraflavitalea sp. H1-2-19X]